MMIRISGKNKTDNIGLLAPPTTPSPMIRNRYVNSSGSLIAGYYKMKKEHRFLSKNEWEPVSSNYIVECNQLDTEKYPHYFKENAMFISNHQKSKFFLELKESPSNWNEGFAKIISGQEIDYFSFNPTATYALISRASDGKSSIEWETSPADKFDENGLITFVWTTGINCNTNEQPFDLEMNGKKILTFSTRFAEEWSINGVDNIKLKFSEVHTIPYFFIFFNSASINPSNSPKETFIKPSRTLLTGILLILG